jgi:hypothetical protein
MRGLVLLVLLCVLVVCEAKCPHGCSQHGSCVSNHCQCYDGYAGVDCSITCVSFWRPRCHERRSFF